MTQPTDVVRVAISKLGQYAPQDTCVSKGVYPICTEAGLPYPNWSDGNGNSRTNVTDLVDAARNGKEGYRLLAVKDAQIGDILVWGDDEYHVSIYTDNATGGKRSIGAGGPSGQIAYQPTRGGGNPDSVFKYAIRPPFAVAAPAPAPASGESGIDRVKRIARYLNERSRKAGWGITTGATSDGIPTNPGSKVSNYYWLVQKCGKTDGLYGEGYDVDGIPGPRTYWLEAHYAPIA